MKQNMVAIVTDGTAVLGLGDIGPEAALPVMEGKAMLFKEFGGVDAFPICLATKDADEIVAIVKAIAPGLRRHQPRGHLGAALLRDRAPAARGARHPGLPRRPARHGDRRARGTAQRAAASSASGSRTSQIVITGCGAAGMAVDEDPARGRRARRSSAATASGALYRGRAGLTRSSVSTRSSTNPRDVRGSADERTRGRRCVHRVVGAGAITRAGIATWPRGRSCSRWPTRRREIEPEEIEDLATVIATGRSDYPNQINNVLAFPGIFRGALDVRARTITQEMELAAAHAIAAIVQPEELSADYIVPSVFAREVAPAVAKSVADAAIAAGVARGELAVAG